MCCINGQGLRCCPAVVSEFVPGSRVQVVQGSRCKTSQCLQVLLIRPPRRARPPPMQQQMKISTQPHFCSPSANYRPGANEKTLSDTSNWRKKYGNDANEQRGEPVSFALMFGVGQEVNNIGVWQSARSLSSAPNKRLSRAAAHCARMSTSTRHHQ